MRTLRSFHVWPAAAVGLAAFCFVASAHQPEKFPLGRPPAKATPGAGAGQFTVEIEGAKGRFKGEGTRESNKDKIVGLRFEYEVHAARDASGRTGKHRHEPLVVSKEWGAASPQIFHAAATGETLKQVTLEFYRTSSGGDSEAFYTIRLTGARIESVKQYSEEGRFYEDVAFAFEKIEVTHVPSKSKAEDDATK